MNFIETKLQEVFIIEIERKEDERGFFARTWEFDEFAQRGLNGKIRQCSISQNHMKGTIRGMHFQSAPYRECKIVRCTKGKIYDVAIDLRQESPTFLKLLTLYHRMLYIPERCAHGFQTLEDGAEVFYQISEQYSPAYAHGVRWNDPAFGIDWPLNVSMINNRDKKYKDLNISDIVNI